VWRRAPELEAVAFVEDGFLVSHLEKKCPLEHESCLLAGICKRLIARVARRRQNEGHELQVLRHARGQQLFHHVLRAEVEPRPVMYAPHEFRVV
jgi:hypothetical protein